MAGVLPYIQSYRKVRSFSGVMNSGDKRVSKKDRQNYSQMPFWVRIRLKTEVFGRRASEQRPDLNEQDEGVIFLKQPLGCYCAAC